MSLRQVRRSTPRDLDAICQKCLAHDRHRRYASAQDVADELHRFLTGEPIVARPAGPLERTVKWARRRPFLAAACVVALVAFAAGIGGLFWHNARLQEAVNLKEEELARRQQQVDEEREAAARKAAERDRWNAYAADMRVGTRLLQSGDTHALHALLQRHVPTPADPVDRRGFEWWHLARMARKSKRAWHAHDGPIGLLAYVDDGNALVTAATVPPWQVTQVKVWDLATITPRAKSLESQQNPPWCVAAVAPDGRAIAMPYESCTDLHIFDLSGRELGSCYCASTIYGLAFLPDGRRIALALDEHVEIRHCEKQPTLPVQGRRIPGRVEKPAPAPLAGVPLVAVARQPDAVEAWDYESNRVSWRVACAQVPTALSAFPRRSWLAIAQGSAPILVCNGNGGNVARLTASGAVQALAVSRDERRLAAATADGSVHLWYTATWRLAGTWRWQHSPIHALAFAPDGRELAVGTADGGVHRLDVSEPLTPMVLGPAQRLDGPVAFSADSCTVAVGASSGEVAIVDAASGQTRRVLPGDDGEALRELVFAPAHDTLAALSRDSGTVRLWDARTGRCLHTLWEPPGRAVRCVAFAADGKVLVTAGTGAEVVAWDVESGQRRRAWNVGTAGVRALAFAPKGHFLACSSAKGELRLWDASGGTAASLARYEVGSGVYGLAWSPDGKTLAVCADPGLVRYDVTNPAQARRVAGDWTQDGVRGTALQYSADGTTLIVADGTYAQLFDSRNGRVSEWAHPPHQWAHPTHHAVALAPSGKRLAMVATPLGGLWLIDRAGHRMRAGGGLLPGAVRSLALTPDANLLAVGRYVDTPIIARRQTDLLGIPFKALYAGQFPNPSGEGIALWDMAGGAPQPALPGVSTLAPPDRVAIAPWPISRGRRCGRLGLDLGPTNAAIPQAPLHPCGYGGIRPQL